MQAIVNVDANWGIGKDGRLLFPIPADMKFFRETTLHKTVVMGRRTLESFPGAKPLAKRHNIVLTRSAHFAPEGVTVCHHMDDLKMALAPGEEADVFVIGGAEVYRLLLPHCSGAIVTKVAAQDDADSFFPNLDALQNWHLERQSETMHHEQITFRYCWYKNSSPRAL